MSTQSVPTRAAESHSAIEGVCAIGAALVGLVLLLYAFYVVPGQFEGDVDPIGGFLVFMAVVGLLSVAAAVGYGMGKTWGWFVHLASVIGQWLFPGSLFEFKLDLYHMVGWMNPLISLVILVLMGWHIRRKRRLA